MLKMQLPAYCMEGTDNITVDMHRLHLMSALSFTENSTLVIFQLQYTRDGVTWKTYIDERFSSNVSFLKYWGFYVCIVHIEINDLLIFRNW